MIGRIWHGWTTPANADAYEALLKREILPGIEGRQIAGCSGIHLFRRDSGEEAIDFCANRGIMELTLDIAVQPPLRPHG